MSDGSRNRRDPPTQRTLFAGASLPEAFAPPPEHRDEEAGRALAPGEVYLSIAVPLPVFELYTWRGPPLTPGTPVRVPYGRRHLHGWVIAEAAACAVPTRGIEQVLGAPELDSEQLQFLRWIADYYLSPLGEVIAAAIPSGASARTRHVYRATTAGLDALAADPPAGEPGTVLREVIAHRSITKTGLERRLYSEVTHVDRALAALLEDGLVVAEDELVAAIADTETWVEQVADASLAGLTPRAVKARTVLERLLSGPAPLKELDREGVRRLERAGVVRRFERRAEAPAVGPVSAPPPLNAEQQVAVAAVNGPGVWLLHGVTGGGKTEVYLALAEKTLAEGRQVLFLVPEIALTPQLTSRVRARFGERVAVLHSALTAAERRKEWHRLRAGEASVAVGARSAIFAPIHQLGLVVVDEEHDDSYKQDDGVRYHARDLAVVRGRVASAAVVLGSATPSLESWENARSGRYTLLSIRERATARKVPQLSVIDMRQEAKVDGREPMISATVREAVADALAAGGKAILLYNRRGYATFVECAGCGQAYRCPSCEVAMVYHQGASRLDCHYCGFFRTFSKDCPKCGGELSVLGKGTERVEEAVIEAFPGVSVARMDADTTSERGSHARILDRFRDGEVQLLVGTQIVAKGHDFPDVHVAAVLGVDHILGMPDFRSAERTFSLVTQLCGRAGRGAVAGRVFLQTHHPEHPVFSCIGNMDAFAERETHYRRVLGYPPYSRLVLVRFEAEDRPDARLAAEAFVKSARQLAAEYIDVDVLGPAVATLPRLVGRWRYQVVLRGKNTASFRHFLLAGHRSWRPPPRVRMIVDVDPRQLS